MRFCAGCTQCKIDESNVKQYERERTIEECKTAVAKAICVGCGYLKDLKCTYNGGNCGVSKPMLESVMKALENIS